MTSEQSKKLPDKPQTPSTAYLDYLSEKIATDARRSVESTEKGKETAATAFHGAPSQWHERVVAVVEQLEEDLAQIVRELHAHPEEGFAEYQSSALLVRILEKHGCQVDHGCYGLDTAFRSEWASQDFEENTHPTIAICAEYDALPGIGHACGHNIIAASGIGAYLAARQVLAENNAAARVVLYGTPAEEGGSGKQLMIEQGAFRECDAAVMVHPFNMDVAEHAWVGRRFLKVTFSGIAAHASAQPFMGRNALDAASLAYQGIGLLRQQMPPSDRVHAIIADGGKRPSIIVDSAIMELNVRSTMIPTLVDLSERIEDIMHGAALMTGCAVRIEWDDNPATLPVRNNHVLAQSWTRAQQGCQRNPVPAGVVPDTVAASTDFGNVSQIIPGIHPMIAVSDSGVALHTTDFAQAAISPAAYRAMRDGSIGLAAVVLDGVYDAQLLQAARVEFEQSGGQVFATELF
ncbi:M20 family metallopeptidase [Corynebacterium sp. sy039]|uniref:M20 family metallopeptidase n=1 Tax=Corynebacterium sp. sy039 TaxID=2599641 RepID=UPI0011B6FDE0|nr:M20 family metallopeptidase [Corynebacterium sp. sy039]QDZ43159.1 M20 family metallopeptidase [Corynebacterium sp. sy039]